MLFAPEVEKEDILFCKVSKEKLLKYGWAKENDGSLNSGYGFEIKPIRAGMGQVSHYPNIVKELIDCAKITNCCGGHINFSNTQESLNQTERKLIPIVPLLVAMYQNRLTNHYCDFAYTANKLRQGYSIPERNSSYSAICNRDNRIEFRFFPAVKNLNQLQWRFDLINLCYSHSELFTDITDVAKGLILPDNNDKINFQKSLFAHLNKAGISPLTFASRVQTTLEKYYKIDVNGIDF